MNEYKDFEAFKAAVITEYNKRSSLSHGFSRVVTRTIGGLMGGILSGILVGGVDGSAPPDLSEFMFNSFLDDNFKKRFEANANNDKQLKNLVKEAVEQLIKKTK